MPEQDSSPILQMRDSQPIPVFLWSDWHIGESVDPAQVFGFNAFNEEIAEQRISSLIAKARKHAQLIPSASKAVLWLGGDMVSGWLHEDLQTTDWCSPFQASHWVGLRLKDAILALSEDYDELHVLCSPGNHGRLTKRPPAKGAAYSSFDWFIYVQLKEMLRSRPGIRFYIPASGDCYAEILGFKFAFTHGHTLGTGGGSGVLGSISPILRGTSRTGRSMTGLNRPFDFLVIGHFHNSIWLPGQGVIANGALVGFSEYAKVWRLNPERPSQTMFFAHPQYGPVIPIELYL